MLLARNAAEELRLDKLVIMPSGSPPHKTLPEGTPDAAHRLEMSRLAAAELGGIAEVSDFELSGGASYTIDTVRMLLAKHRPEKLWLLLGSDAWESFHNWRGADEILKLAEVYVVPREIYPVSSTELRERLTTDSGQRAEDKLPAAVLNYIRKEGLYGVPKP
jgi:nicotinate-nucleotide adenylyltransferase